MPEFTMDGYRDRESVADTLVDSGAIPQANAEQIVAVVVAALLKRVEGMDFAGDELHDACAGIVDCAEKDGLL